MRAGRAVAVLGACRFPPELVVAIETRDARTSTIRARADAVIVSQGGRILQHATHG